MSNRIVAKPSEGNSSRRRRKLTDYGGSNTWDGSKDNLNVLHQVYRGRFDRFERYRMYEWMDQDSDISRALDLISEHSSEKDPDGRHFILDWYTEEPTAELSSVLKAHMDQWSKINRLDKHLFKTMRNVLKYGDWFMFRNPHTFELYDIHPMDVLGAIVDRNTLDILGWVIRDFRWNITDLEINVESREMQAQLNSFNSTNTATGNAGQATRAIPAIHVLHFSLSEGKLASNGLYGQSQYTNAWPFGNSWLEKAYKTFKQRELLEDAALIHRVQRAPSRHVWYIDTGKMRHDRSKFVIQNFKNELNQKRIPQFIGSNSRGVDSVYNPISQLEDIYIPVSMDQRGSKVEQLEGTPWSDMPDLDYFKQKMAAALRVPYAWLLPAGEGGITPSDGRMGQATQEEIEFSRFCSRLHTYMIETWDHEFKLYSRWRDVSANWADFQLLFIPPTDYQASKDRARLSEASNAFKNLVDLPFLSKRLLMKLALGWTDDQIAMNEKMVDEENNRKEASSSMDGGFGGGAGMPMGDMPTDPGLPLADGGAQAPSVTGGMDAGAGGGGDLGAGMAGGGAMEGIMRRKGNPLFEDELDLPGPKLDMTDMSRVPKDPSVLGQDRVAGKPIATLELIQRIRHAHFSKRVDWQKRLKMLNRVYGSPAEDAGGMGLGGM
jgi:hypothetical protein